VQTSRLHAKESADSSAAAAKAVEVTRSVEGS
jgi:hypothetical protein